MDPRTGLRIEVERKMRVLFDNTYEANKSELDVLLATVGISKESLLDGILSYTLGIDFRKFDNDEYKDIVMRSVLHFHNLIDGTYHTLRHTTVADFLEETNSQQIIDIGYGVAGPYMFRYLKKNSNATITLADQDKNAEAFSRILTKQLHPEFENRFKYLLHDMNSFIPPTGFGAYVMMDSIEHCTNPTKYLTALVKTAPESHFIFSIPICSMETLKGFHFDEWLTREAAEKWLTNNNLQILEGQMISINPAIDYFAEFLGGFSNYIVLCKPKGIQPSA